MSASRGHDTITFDGYHATAPRRAPMSSRSATADSPASVESSLEPFTPAGEEKAVSKMTGSQEASTSKDRGMAALPNEILDLIFALLDGPPPSNSGLYGDPSYGLTSSKEANIKSCSSVCKRWRRRVLPLLFRHPRLLIEDPMVPKPILRDEHLPLLDFIEKNSFKSIVKSFSLSIFHVPIRHNESNQAAYRRNNFTEFWTKLFERMDPLVVKIVCSPQVLGVLTCCEVVNSDAAYFEMPYHLLCLSRPLVPPPDEPTPNSSEDEDFHPHAPIRPSTLFQIRPWRTLLFNEGSFLRAYKTYDFHQKLVPSILNDLIGGGQHGPHAAMIPTTIRDFSYVATFPVSNHFYLVPRCLPRLDRLYCQLVPRSDVLNDPVQMEDLDVSDMWLERNSCYAFLMRELFSHPPLGNYRYLKEFESGDAADPSAWEIAVDCVKRAGGGWVIERPGVFIKIMEVGTKHAEVEAQVEEVSQVQLPAALLVSDERV